MTSTISGLLLLDKPAGLTSQQAVVRVRNALGADHAGHTGTLDPFATGLLLILLGRATRLARFVEAEPKEYEVLIRFGVETDTDDRTGDPVRTAAPPSQTSVIAALDSLTGNLTQTPPAFSAKHVDGQRAYRLARAGTPADLRPVTVRVDRWDVVAQSADSLHARIRCAGGTYIRALARDLGRLTNSAAHCVELRRLRCGAFSVDDAVAPDRATAVHVRPVLSAVVGLPRQEVDDANALGVAQGRPVAATVPGERVALVKDGELLAIAERAADRWHPRVVLTDPSTLAPRA